ncbi:MAG TPA: hypothetical protein VGI75_02735 [Pirellulales bacterium]
MAKASADEMWVLCPHCLVRGLIPRSAQGMQVRCRQCETVFVAEPEPPSREELEEEELQLAPLDLPPAAGTQTAWESPEAEYGMAPEEPVAHPMVGKMPPIPPAPPEKLPEYMIAPPVGAGLFWAFRSNTFTFPWHLSGMLQWIYASGGLMFALGLDLAAYLVAVNFALVEPMVLVAAVLLNLVCLSYLVASLYEITVNAAYNCDKLHDWPHAAWTERLIYLIRALYLGAIAAMLALGIAGISSVASDIFWPVFFGVIFLLFPFLMLSGLEADSYFWPVSKPMFRSLRVIWAGWLVFYVLSGLLLGGCAWLTNLLVEQLEFKAPLALGPLWAATVFIYGRLLGRLTWLILQHDDLVAEKKIQAPDLGDSLMQALP